MAYLLCPLSAWTTVPVPVAAVSVEVDTEAASTPAVIPVPGLTTWKVVRTPLSVAPIIGRIATASANPSFGRSATCSGCSIVNIVDIGIDVIIGVDIDIGVSVSVSVGIGVAVCAGTSCLAWCWSRGRSWGSCRNRGSRSRWSGCLVGVGIGIGIGISISIGILVNIGISIGVCVSIRVGICRCWRCGDAGSLPAVIVSVFIKTLALPGVPLLAFAVYPGALMIIIIMIMTW